MSETTKFEVIDRRKYKAEEEEHESAAAAGPEPAKPEPAKPAATAGAAQQPARPEKHPAPAAELQLEDELLGEMPPPPTAKETSEQQTAYEASAERLEDLVRAQNPGVGAQQPVTFEQLVQQFYLTAMLQMGAATPEGERPRIDILGARQTIDLLGILAEKTRGNLSDGEDRMLQTVLYEARMTFLEMTRMITMQGVHAPPAPKGKN